MSSDWLFLLDSEWSIPPGSNTRIPAIERAVTSLLILKWRLFLFPEATAIIRNEVKSMNTQIIAIANQKGRYVPVAHV